MEIKKNDKKCGAEIIVFKCTLNCIVIVTIQVIFVLSLTTMSFIRGNVLCILVVLTVPYRYQFQLKIIDIGKENVVLCYQ